MNKTQIQSLIENLRMQTAANSITPNMLANILTALNDAAGETGQQNTNITIESDGAPLLYCEVIDNQLYLRNASYYQALGLQPILFRYIRKRNRWNVRGSSRKYGAHKKGWFANGKQGTLKVSSSGLVERSEEIVNTYKSGATDYSSSASVFVVSDPESGTQRGVTWGCSQITKYIRRTSYRMLKLPFAIGFAPKVTSEEEAVTLSKLVSNLAPFYIRGQVGEDEYIWRFSK